MKKFLVVHSHYSKERSEFRLTDTVEAQTMESKIIDGGTSVVILRDDEGRLIGVVNEFDAVYLLSAVRLNTDSTE